MSKKSEWENVLAALDKVKKAYLSAVGNNWFNTERDDRFNPVVDRLREVREALQVINTRIGFEAPYFEVQTGAQGRIRAYTESFDAVPVSNLLERLESFIGGDDSFDGLGSAYAGIFAARRIAKAVLEDIERERVPAI